MAQCSNSAQSCRGSFVGPLWKNKFVAYLPIPALADAAPHRQSVAARIATRSGTAVFLVAFLAAHPPPHLPPCPRERREAAKRRCQIGASAAPPSAGPSRPSQTRIRGLAE